MIHDLILRTGLISATVLLFFSSTMIWVQGETFYQPANLIINFVVWALAMTLLIIALVRTVPRSAAWLILLAALVSVGTQAYLIHQNATPLTINHTDNEMIAQFAVEALQQGENPYAWNFADMLRAYRDQGAYYTPFLDGAYQQRVTYPALPTLVYTAIDWIGLDFGQGPARTVGLITTIVVLVLVFLSAPKSMRPIILLPLFVMSDILNAPLNGVQDIVWSACLIGVILTWKHPLRSALLYGVACSFRQQPWFVAPFLVIYMWHEDRTPREKVRRILTFFALSASVFIITNLPFILWDLDAWAAGVLEPSYAAFNYLSAGFSILTEYGVVPLPREFYTVVQASSLLIMLFLYWRYAPLIRRGFWIFPGIFFWFYYRGLLSYWTNWIPVILVVIAGGAGHALTESVRWPTVVPRRKFTFVFITLILGANVIWGFVLINRAPQIDITYTPPVETYHIGLANRLNVTVQNRSDRILSPRFAVRPTFSAQTLPWRIVSGPLYLQPGEQADYTIDAQTIPSRAFPIDRGAQMVVTDASGDYSLYSTLLIPAMTHAEQPDGIANTDFRYWLPNSPAPERWALLPSHGSIPTARLASVADRMALIIEAATNPNLSELPIVRIQQEIAFSDSLMLWVYPTSTPLHSDHYVYGIELDDGLQRIWVLFGEVENEFVGDAESRLHHIVYRDAPPNIWSQQTIDLRTLYDEFGWVLPSPTTRFAGSASYQTPQLRLSLIVGARSDQTERWVFGSITHSARPQADVIADALDHPDIYYTGLGNNYRQQRNFAHAEDAYRTAISYNAKNAVAYFGLAESRFWQAEFVLADTAYKTALMLDYPNVGDAQKGIGWSQFNLGDYELAHAAFEAAVTFYRAEDSERLVLSLTDAYQGLGWVWLQLGDCVQAIASFEQALAVEGNTPGAIAGLAQCASNPAS